MSANRRVFSAALALALPLAFALSGAKTALATWSVVVTDHRTKEVGIASVTCLDRRFDLRAITPVVLPGLGAAAVQAAGDFDGLRRPIIHEELLAGTPPEDILALLAAVFGHQDRQYGIADTQGRKLSFSGTGNADWKGGVLGELGDLGYAIQGNILAGSCVVPEAERALRETGGDMAERLMAAMEAARDAGGDGRCSCSEVAPTACGCPLPLTRSGHIGYLIVARIGDVADPLCNAAGCADGSYIVNINVRQADTDPDPVDAMRAELELWREANRGRPDAILSEASFRPEGAETEMEVRLRDWAGDPLATGAATVSVEHEADSAGRHAIGPVIELGDGVFTVRLSPDGGLGLDRLRVSASDGLRTAILMPSPELCAGAPCFCDPASPEGQPPGPAAELVVGAGGVVAWRGAERATTHLLRTGELALLAAEGGPISADCERLTVPELVDARPPGGDGLGFYYFASGRDDCGAEGPAGRDSLGRLRPLADCP